MDSEQEQKTDIEALSNSSQLDATIKAEENENEKNITPNAPLLSPPPNGGTMAWLQVLGCFFLWFGSL
jgi:hypothetical protein